MFQQLLDEYSKGFKKPANQHKVLKDFLRENPQLRLDYETLHKLSKEKCMSIVNNSQVENVFVSAWNPIFPDMIVLESTTKPGQLYLNKIDTVAVTYPSDPIQFEFIS